MRPRSGNTKKNKNTQFDRLGQPYKSYAVPLSDNRVARCISQVTTAAGSKARQLRDLLQTTCAVHVMYWEQHMRNSMLDVKILRRTVARKN